MSSGKRYFISLKQKGKSFVELCFEYREHREAFLIALNKKVEPWDLFINIWEQD